MHYRTSLTKRARLFIFCVFLATVNSGFAPVRTEKKNEPEKESLCLYEQLGLSDLGLKEEIFDRALAGLNKVVQKNLLEKPSILSIVDLSQSSNCKRLYVIDLETKQIMFN